MILVFLPGLPGVGTRTVEGEMQALTGYPLFHHRGIVEFL